LWRVVFDVIFRTLATGSFRVPDALLGIVRAALTSRSSAAAGPCPIAAFLSGPDVVDTADRRPPRPVVGPVGKLEWVA
jgi:hypothetical protein